MGIEKILNEYIFSNVGQFRAITSSLGYKESYDRGELTFSNGSEECRLSLEEIRNHTGKGETPARPVSMERLCQFLDKEKALPGDKALSEKGVSICDWGDLKGDSKSRFTVVDHEGMICYTGKELYDYAAENGYLLDGKGTKLEKGVLSGMTSVKGKPAKVRLTENGISVFYRKESLVIPDKILGHRLSQRDKEGLIAGDIVPVRGDKGDFFLQVDRDLNAVIIRSHKELSIPFEIGGYELTVADKYLLANGHSIDNKLLKTEEGCILANVRLTPDKKSYEISNIQAIPEAKARQLLQSREETQGKLIVQDNNLEIELMDAVKRHDLDKIASLHEAGYSPSAEIIKALGEEPGLSVEERERVLSLFGVEPPMSKEPILGQDEIFCSAVEKGDFSRIAELGEQGYKPSKELMESLSATAPEANVVAAGKILDLKATTNALGDVRLARKEQPEASLNRPITQTINNMFNNM